MNPQLHNKVGVLYVLENDVKSYRALELAQTLPEIYVQYVGLLSAEQIPPWLKEVPTCVTLQDRRVHTGTEALQLLSALWQQRHRAAAAAGPQSPPTHAPPLSLPPGSLSQRQHHPPTNAPPLNATTAAAPPAVLRGSLQPASGTGQFGCSLDAAFAPLDDSSGSDHPTPPPSTDARLSSTGKIQQNDIESYMRMREQTTSTRGRPPAQLQ